jgi:hypothetical protein
VVILVRSGDLTLYILLFHLGQWELKESDHSTGPSS